MLGKTKIPTITTHIQHSSTVLGHKPAVAAPPSSRTRRMCCISNASRHSGVEHFNGLTLEKGTRLLKDLSTWGIGGPCNYFVRVFDHSQLLSAIRFCRENALQYIVIGRGSNCLFDDSGFDGCVILNRIEFLERVRPGTYRVGGGFRFNRLGVQCSDEGFGGLEFAAGVPGTVGGAVFMNAGANGQETADVVDSVDIVTDEGKFQRFTRDELVFGYRSSLFQDMKELGAIVSATFRLQSSNLARSRQRELLERRRMSQPLGERSAGSVFRNPSDVGITAAELIEGVGLKGLRVGGAMVSNVHANFFINVGGSTSEDMLDLIALVKAEVYKKYGVQLKQEVSYIAPCEKL